VDVYKRQLDEIEDDLNRGALDGDLAEAAKTEIQRRLIRASQLETAGVSQTRSFSIVYVTMMTAVLVGGASLYLMLGTPTMPDFPKAVASGTQQNTVRQIGDRTIDISETIARIRTRLAESPDEKMGWFALGHFEAQAGNPGKSAEAFQRAHELDPENYNFLLMYGESLVVLADQKVTPAALLAFRRANILQPEETGAQFYIALADYQAGEVARAYEIWQRISERTNPSDPWVSQLNYWLKTARNDLGLDSQDNVNNSAVAPTLSQEQIDTVSAMSEEDQIAFIRQMVERLATSLSENPVNTEGWLRLAQAYLVLEEPEKAKDSFRQALKYAPPEAHDLIQKELDKIP